MRTYLGAPRVGDNVSLQDLEREHILRIMTRVRDRMDAVTIPGIAEPTLWRRIAKRKGRPQSILQPASPIFPGCIDRDSFG